MTVLEKEDSKMRAAILYDLVSERKASTKKLITQEIPLDKLPQTMEQPANKQLKATKAIVKP
jgi:threonine dehydrogenase-like Zn-dependent dehydrogenase